MESLSESICAPPKKPWRCRLGIHAWFEYEMTFVNHADRPTRVEFVRLCPLCRKVVSKVVG